MQESFFARCAPIELTRKTILAQVRKRVANIAKKTQRTNLVWMAKQNGKPKIQENQRKTRKAKREKPTKKTGKKRNKAKTDKLANN